MKLLCIGDNVCDVYIHLKTMYPGGQALNVAVYAKTMGIESAYIGVFGHDEVADHIIKTIDEYQLDYSHCKYYDEPNGFAMVTLVDGDRVFIGGNEGGASKTHPLEFTTEELDYISQYSIIHTSNNGHIDAQLPVLFKTGVPISYDFSRQWVGDMDWFKQLAPYCTFGFFSLPDESTEEEVRNYCNTFHSAGVKYVIATLGSRGSCFYDGTHLLFKEPYLVKPVDTLGAGDSFAAAFLVNFIAALEENPEAMAENETFYLDAIKKAQHEGATLSSKTCLVRGAFEHGKIIDPAEYLAKEYTRNPESLKYDIG